MSESVASAQAGSDPYQDLAFRLAGAGRIREAALAQWAADLRALAPALRGRVDELCGALGDLAPADAAGAVASARAVATALSPEAAAVPLVPLTHLVVRDEDGPAPDGGAPLAPRLPIEDGRAFARLLHDTAARSGDTGKVSVDLRLTLAELVSRGSTADLADLARVVLEPHERLLLVDRLERGSMT
jgi:hypothetical protein